MRSVVGMLAVCLAGAPSMAAQEESDERGVWVAQVNPTTKDMFVTDCPCESSPGIEFTCKRGSGVARVELKDFDGAKGKIGDVADIAFEIDGTRSKRAATLADSGGHNLPVFDVALDDPFLDALSAGRALKLSYGKEIARTRLKGARKAIATMRDYCRK